ncbi:uncharacterized protein [Nicotiana tomentosiformis]|uniref:uncharacterized protein n=1 Tax=Nicotiana tomentosiformis TaxID=4098 RepID=UPI00388C5B72
MLRKIAATSWTDVFQKAFNKIKEYLSKLLVLVPPEPGRPLLLYLSVLEGSFGCVLGQHDETGRKEHAIYYLSKKFTPYEAWQSKGKHWQITWSKILVNGEYEPLKTYFPDEDVSFVEEDISEAYNRWRMFFDGATNFKGVGIGVVLVSKTGQHYPVLGECALKNTKILTYLHCVQELIKRFTKIEFKHVPRIQNDFVDALVTLSSMIKHQDKNFIDPIPIGIHKQPAYCARVEEEIDGNLWFHDIIEYLEKGEYPEHATNTQKPTLRRLANHFFRRGGILFKRTPDLGLLRYVDAKEASILVEEIHAGTCGPHMNGFVLAMKILRAEYF